MANILAIDTSSDGCSAALMTNNAVYSRFDCEPRQHTKLIMAMVKEVIDDSGLEKSELDAIAFASGPGSFTGLRISAGVAQGLAAGLDLPVVPVSTLKGLANDECLNSYGRSVVATALDARMSEIYWGLYLRDGINGEFTVTPLQEDSVVSPAEIVKKGLLNLESLRDEDIPIIAIGSGWSYLEDIEQSTGLAFEHVFPREVTKASSVARLAQVEFAKGHLKQAYEAIPVYVRDEITWKKLPGR